MKKSRTSIVRTPYYNWPLLV